MGKNWNLPLKPFWPQRRMDCEPNLCAPSMCWLECPLYVHPFLTAILCGKCCYCPNIISMGGQLDLAAVTATYSVHFVNFKHWNCLNTLFLMWECTPCYEACTGEWFDLEGMELCVTWDALDTNILFSGKFIGQEEATVMGKFLCMEMFFKMCIEGRCTKEASACSFV